MNTVGFRLPVIPAAPVSQSVTNDIWHKKPKEWLPCLVHTLKQKNRVKD